jgi:TolB-like protein
MRRVAVLVGMAVLLGMAMTEVACNKLREEEQRRAQNDALALENLKLKAEAKSADKKSIYTIAVLPFTADGTSADRQKLAESFTLKLTVQLSRVPKLKVISTEKIKSQRIQESPPTYPWTTNGLQTARNLLGATAAVVGRLSEEDQSMVLTVQLVDLEANETLLWAEQYKFKELKDGKAEEVQKWREETIQRIADQVAQELTSDKVPQPTEK